MLIRELISGNCISIPCANYKKYTQENKINHKKIELQKTTFQFILNVVRVGSISTMKVSEGGCVIPTLRPPAPTASFRCFFFTLIFLIFFCCCCISFFPARDQRKEIIFYSVYCKRRNRKSILYFDNFFFNCDLILETITS